MASINKVSGFENYNFYIPATANPGDTLLTVTKGTDLSNSTVKLVGVNGSRKWAVGESVILIDNGSNTITGVDSKLTGKTTQSIKKYKYEIEKIDSNKKLQAKSLSEGRIAGLGSLDLAADKGMANATEQSSGKGGTGIAEVGIIYKPTDKSNFSMDLGVSDYAGKREGFGGQMKLNWTW